MAKDWAEETQPMRTPTRDDILDSFAVEENPAAMLITYQMKFPHLADELNELAQALNEIEPCEDEPELTPEQEAEQAAFVEESWKRFQAMNAIAKAFPIQIPDEFTFIEKGAKVRHKELGDGVVHGSPKKVAETGEWVCLAHAEGSEVLRWVSCKYLELRP